MMAENELASWQQALDRWDKWTDSVNKTRAEVQQVITQEKYVDLDNLKSHAKVSYTTETGEDGSTVTRIELEENEEAILLFRLYEEVSDKGSEFITKEMGIERVLWFHQIFLDYWMKSVLGMETLPMEQPRPITLESRLEGNRIRNSVSWYDDEADLGEVARFLERMKWPFHREDVIRQSKGGRHKEEERKNVEAIICCVLRYKHKQTIEDIAGRFGWSTYLDSYEKLMSNTLWERLSRGRELIRKHGIAVDLPTEN